MAGLSFFSWLNNIQQWLNDWMTENGHEGSLWGDGQEATVRTGHGTIDWSQIGKGVHQSCILSPCLLNLYVEYIMWNAGLDEVEAVIKIAGRNINNLRYADDTTLMAESQEKQTNLLMKVKEECWKSWLKTQQSKNKDHSIQSHHFMAKIWEAMETVTAIIFLGS